jgi:hypothetical protein
MANPKGKTPAKGKPRRRHNDASGAPLRRCDDVCTWCSEGVSDAEMTLKTILSEDDDALVAAVLDRRGFAINAVLLLLNMALLCDG